MLTVKKEGVHEMEYAAATDIFKSCRAIPSHQHRSGKVENPVSESKMHGKYVTVVRLRPSSFRVDPQLELVGRQPCRDSSSSSSSSSSSW